MSVIEERLAALETLWLASGSHAEFEKGACIMEAVAYVAGEPHSDHPECASPLLTSFLISMNDRLGDDDRQILKPFIPRLVGTNTGPDDEATRKWMLCDWLVHEYAPAIFRASGLTAEAERFEALAAITGAGEWESARTTIYDVRDKAWKRRRAAVAAADADAVAAAAAAAIAVAVADAAAAAVAAFAQAVKAAAKAKKNGGDYWEQRSAAYAVLRPHYDEVWKERFVEIGPGLRQSVLGLIDRMIEVGR